jgi:hypothetical protein
VNLSSGANSYDSRVNPYRVICVRGGTRNLPTQLSVLSGPTSVGLNQVPHSTTPLYVTIKDASGTRVNAGGRTVTISATNLGTLGGTLTATTDHTGLATFTGFTLNTAGSATITISSSGLTDTTRTINVAAGSLGIPCLIEDGFFQSADGGCKEMASGLVWSTISTSTMTWYAAVWDSLLAGSTAIDADDASRGNDYSESAAEDCNLGGYLSCDNSTNTYQSGSINIVSYCKNLNEGGKTDWRLPTRTEINSAYSAGAPSHLTGSLNQYFWVSSGYPGNPYSYMVNLSTGVNSYDSRVNPYRVICVRGGTRNSPTKLTVTSGTAINGASITGATITVRVQDASSNNVNASGRSVTISGTNLGTLGGTVTGTTDHTGKVTFSAFTLDTAGFATLTISSAGLTSATHNIEIRAGILAGQHVCRAESSRFITQYGGCHDTTEHLVWSAMSSGTYNWYQTVWDSTLASNNAPDGDDGVRTNDYDLSYGPLGYTDTSLVDYCHDLNQGGYTDWKPATVTQVTNAGTAAAAGTYFDSSLIGVNFWTGGTYQAGGSWPSWGWYGSFSSSTYSSTVVDKNTAYKVVCVRAQN